MTAVKDPATPGLQDAYVAAETPRELRLETDIAVDACKLPLTPTDNSKPSSTSEDGKKSAADTPAKSFSFSQLYRYATPMDKALLVFGVLMSVANGAIMLMMTLVFGNAITSFSPTVDQKAVNKAALDYLLIAVGMFVTDYIAYITFHFTAERQMRALRGEALKHMLYLDITWYDSNDAMQLSSRLTGDTVKIKEGMGQKLGELFKFVTQFIVGFVIGFAKGWDISLIMACVMPAMAASLAWLIKILQTRTEWAQKVYAEAGAVAEETLGSMRTVASLNGEKKAMERYNEKTLAAEKENIALARLTSMVLGVFIGSIWIMYACGLWYGGHKVASNKTDPGKVFQAFFGILMGTMSMAQISPNLTAVAQASGSAAAIFKILDTPSAIDASSDDGIVPTSCEGAVEAIDVHFTYPSRPDAPILKGYNVKIEAGQTVAFVGSSGGGKSTLIALLERFYDPSSGSILLDGRDVKTLNVKWLRSQIGLVSQEPVLFATTIFENVAAGLTATGKPATREQVEAAAKLANAHTFIMALPQKYDTLVGEKGVSLSGGQKQRVAIARAIVREPKILVLDEATSALDNESERVVQDALNDLMDKTKMTTLVIAHRLSTVRRADKIVVLSGGVVVEEGCHDELVQLEDGIYRTMYKIQELRSNEESAAAAADLGAAGVGVDLDEHARRDSFTSVQSDQSMGNVENNAMDKVKVTVMDILRWCKPERSWFFYGTVGSAVLGFSMPASALLMSAMITSMTDKYYNYQATGIKSYLTDLKHEVMIYGLCYVGGAVVVTLAAWLQVYAFRIISEKLTTRLRHINFSALCRQNIGFFDEKQNATGALTADLATNATKVALMSGESQGRVLQAAFVFIAALAISFGTGSWLLTIIMLAVFPLLIAGHAVRMNQLKGSDAIPDELADSGAHASEVLSNIRTVAALGLEKTASDRFHVLLEEPMKKGSKEAQINGLMLGFSSFIMMATYALVFWYGGKLVKDGDITFGQLIRSLMAIMMSVQGVSGASSWLGDSQSATKSGSAIMSLRDRKVPIDSFDVGGIVPSRVEGRLEFKNITFRYPTRSEVTVLKSYNLTIEPGQTVAFCGPSGGGKSTIISLIERFYDPVKGDVLLDGVNLKDLNLQWLRSQIGLVGQEPTLFIGTIADNIAYGLKEKPSQAEIEEAAKMANAHDFITKFPDGYETQVGMKGEQLSGGQKQRIAIARAILKNPNVLLLDEATSALDSESEKVVQEALDKVVALKKRTTIIIAHRLSTIRKADKICVVSGGKIAEAGTHQELLQQNGIYARLVESASA